LLLDWLERPETRELRTGIKNWIHLSQSQMDHGDFHSFMKDYMEKTCPSKDGAFGSWCAFEEELNKYRSLSKTLKMCGYYSANLDCKIDEISKNVKDLKQLARESKQKFSDVSTKERVESSFKHWLYGTTASNAAPHQGKA